MPFTSPFPPLRIQETDLLTYLFPPGQSVSDKPLWIDAANPDNSLSPSQMLRWVKRLAIGLDKIGCARGQAALIYTPNHILVPAAYMGIVGSGRIFSGANPAYTESGMMECMNHCTHVSCRSHAAPSPQQPQQLQVFTCHMHPVSIACGSCYL